jgi:ribosomal-protein-alanine N-acetyltransferase
MKSPIETERFVLRNLETTDAQGMFELDSDPDVLIYLGNNPLSSIEQSKKIIESVHKQYKKNGIGRWAIIDKNTNEFIGWTGLKYEENVREDFNYYDLGYRLKKKFWEKGIATETSLISLNYGFSELKLKKISATAHVKNIPSNKVLQKVGFTFKELILIDNEPCNWYEITKPEWVKKQN